MIISVFDGMKGGQDDALQTAMGGQVQTNEGRLEGQSTGFITAFTDIPKSIKSAWMTYMPTLLGGSSEDSAEIEKKAASGFAGVLSEGGEVVGLKIGESINSALAIMGRDEKFTSLKRELLDLTKGFTGDETLTKEQFMKKYLTNEAQYYNQDATMLDKDTFGQFSPERRKFRSDLDTRYQAGVESGDFISQGFTEEQAAAYKSNRQLFHGGGKQHAGSAMQIESAERMRLITAAYLKTDEYKKTVAKGEELQSLYQQFIDTYQARMANTQLGSGGEVTTINNNSNDGGGGAAPGNITIIDISGGQVPGYGHM